MITGAASGIGLATAKLCSKHGMKLALVDINYQNLAKARSSFSNGEAMEIYNMDVGKIEEWKTLKKSVESKFGGVDFLMLNAGIGLQGGWEDIDYFYKVSDPLSVQSLRP